MHPLRVLITAGPTHEPIDRVRYIANRSSGRIGIEIAESALDAGWHTTLALGPTHLLPRTTPRPDSLSVDHSDTQQRSARFRLLRFQTTDDLAKLLAEEELNADILVMAAAVADYRVSKPDHEHPDKLRRSSAGMTLTLESTPDLIADCVRRRARSGEGKPRLIVAFALEPADELIEKAREKLVRKGADLIVANPLETMDAHTVQAYLLGPEGTVAATPGKIDKQEFGAWLIRELTDHLGR
ncbi:MAG: phosphopantothenoylcysteine decarboxylase [Phycisphaerales bacterium JB065]